MRRVTTDIAKRESEWCARRRAWLKRSIAGMPEEWTMHDHDVRIGRLLTRREALALITAGALCASRAARSAALACVARPQQTEGPFFVNEHLTRSDIRSDPASGRVSPGAPLDLAIAVAGLARDACTPLRGATVEVWQCDADGRYSDVRDFGGSTVGQRFLRGNQPTDDDGVARFTTIVPGWYQGRAVHIHFRIDATTAGGAPRTFTSQLYFDDAFLDRIHARAPYAARGPRPVRNARDGLFRDGGSQLLLDVNEAGERLAARFEVGLTV
jgi:protocatechuate 3,4-dioxygenase beta subunit